MAAAPPHEKVIKVCLADSDAATMTRCRNVHLKRSASRL